MKRKPILLLLFSSTGISASHFPAESHDMLLDEKGADILPHLLLPLAGPEEFDEEDNEKLPPDLQYLNENKERDKNLEVRKLLLELLYMVMNLYDSVH